MSATSENYNVVVIGAGTAGLVTAAGTAGRGGRVALIERHKMGGDCLNYGCVPSKALISSARAIETIRRAERWRLKKREPAGFDAILVAAERCPNVEGLNWEAASGRYTKQEIEAKQKGIEYDLFTQRMDDVNRAVVEGEMKLTDWPWKWIGLGVAGIGLLVAVRLLPMGAWLPAFNEGTAAAVNLWGGVTSRTRRSELAPRTVAKPLVRSRLRTRSPPTRRCRAQSQSELGPTRFLNSLVGRPVPRAPRTHRSVPLGFRWPKRLPNAIFRTRQAR